jgi:Ca-activated chloride channel homolog
LSISAILLFELGFSFQHITFNWLWLGVPVLLFLYLLYYTWHRRSVKKIGQHKLVQNLLVNYSPVTQHIKFFIVLLAFAVGIITVLNPRRAGKGESTIRKGMDIAIALDVSNSMLATDLAPNRLERAKQFVTKYLAASPNDRVALILFAGSAYLQMPLTTDHVAAGLFVASASPSIITQQGTVISEALKMSANAFSNTSNQYKAVVLITDGEGHDEEAVETAKELATQGVMINTVGIGSTQGSTLPGAIPGAVKMDEAGNVVVSKLNDILLKEIAASTNGIYLHLQTTDEAVKQLQQQMTQIDKKVFTDTTQLSYKNYFTWFAAAMFVFLLIELFISEKIKTTIKMNMAK